MATAAPTLVAIRTVDVEPNANGKYSCPECGAEMPDKAHLGIHRKKHGVQGTSHNALATQARQNNRGNAAIPKNMINQIHSMRARGVTQREIAAQLGISTTTVKFYLKQRRAEEHKPAHGMGVSIKPAVVDRIMRLHNNGLSNMEISKRVGVSYTTVLVYVKKGGAVLKPGRPTSKISRPQNSSGERTRTTPEEEAQIAKLLSSGMPQTQVAQTVNRSLTVIRRIITQQIQTKESMNGQPATPELSEIQQELDYAHFYGRIEREAELFCLSRSISFAHVAARMANFWGVSSRRNGIRNENRMPALRGSTT